MRFNPVPLRFLVLATTAAATALAVSTSYAIRLNDTRVGMLGLALAAAIMACTRAPAIARGRGVTPARAFSMARATVLALVVVECVMVTFALREQRAVRSVQAEGDLVDKRRAEIARQVGGPPLGDANIQGRSRL